MDANVAAQLLALNQKFYQTFAEPFSTTRARLQPGVQRLLAQIPTQTRVLDLGCGNGNLARALARRGHQGVYVGLDWSEDLLTRARAGQPDPDRFQFHQADLAADDWDGRLAGQTFDVALAFAVLHHLPGEALRLQLLARVRNLLAPGGRLMFSNWQFLNSPRLRQRIQPWEVIGLREADVDPGDYLLDWRRGGSGLRYVHHFDLEELTDLAAQAGFRVLETFHSDGEGGNLGLYQVWALEP